MVRKLSVLLAAAGGLTAFIAVDIAAAGDLYRSGPRSTFMRLYGTVKPPIGFTLLCDRHPEDCRAGAARRERIELTPERWNDLDTVNNVVNSTVMPVSDQSQYGQIEAWRYPYESGDCEDYVLLKRRLLQQRGWPASALLITVARDAEGGGHAVLIARTAQGDFLLDNQIDDVVLWHEAPYRYIKRQSSRDPSLWMSLVPPRIEELIASTALAE